MPRIFEAKFSSTADDLIGKVCACSLGRVGVVYGRGEITFANGDKGEFWQGFGLDGRGLWATNVRHDVVVIAESLKEYAERVKSRPSNVLYAVVGVAAPK
jgi:hypothetical protein